VRKQISLEIRVKIGFFSKCEEELSRHASWNSLFKSTSVYSIFFRTPSGSLSQMEVQLKTKGIFLGKIL
jgi:hypothetical protein